MGNYSYLIKVINGKNTIVNWNAIENENIKCNYFYFDKDEVGTSLEDYANFLHDKRLFGYLIPSYMYALCRVCANTKFINDENKNTIMYFEEEGWDRLHYLEFKVGTEDVNWGSIAFNFDTEYYENKYKEKFEQNIKNKLTNIFNKKEYNSNLEDYIYEKTEERRKEYFHNLIFDDLRKWNITKLDYNKKETDSKILLYMTIMGIRQEDVVKNPEKYLDFFDKIKS